VFVSVGPRGLTGDPSAKLPWRATYGKDPPDAGSRSSSTRKGDEADAHGCQDRCHQSREEPPDVGRSTIVTAARNRDGGVPSSFPPGLRVPRGRWARVIRSRRS